jgi:hypothetical protein
MSELAVQLRALNIFADPNTARGREALSRFGAHLDDIQGRVSASRVIPSKAKACLNADLSAARAGVWRATADGRITDDERSGLVRRAAGIGVKTEALVAAQRDARNDANGGVAYTRILCAK